MLDWRDLSRSLIIDQMLSGNGFFIFLWRRHLAFQSKSSQHRVSFSALFSVYIHCTDEQPKNRNWQWTQETLNNSLDFVLDCIGLIKKYVSRHTPLYRYTCIIPYTVGTGISPDIPRLQFCSSSHGQLKRALLIIRYLVAFISGTPLERQTPENNLF
jgi:hypothetical protein